ncbi:hypothetical protein D3870_14980 [Noviherbaspirillum cavernae]|uniref:Uncharacterized protein n=1 Tax=Noviherbaspirillum cavernae TaxID=2320862 RepID=A0A418X3U1_9BURK|nr:hypothetical protein D3870_14980 [Noviherbaspirillum cavernae]
MLGIVLTFPFLLLAWPGGMIVVAITGTEGAYLVGAGITIFLQVLALIFLVQLLRSKATS